jgi:2-(1,2-epoxy-1,2-dihydrophenyl)acetyl-CoA isomerase
MKYSNLIVTKEKGVCKISLNRPEVFNALNTQIKEELLDVFQSLSEDEAVRVVVLTGEGSAFCSGQDLKEALLIREEKYSDILRKYYQPLILNIQNLPLPIICQLNGIAAGAGCSLALACDMIIAADTAVLTELFIGIGLVPDAGSGYFLPRMAGRVKAFDLATMGTKISAQQALNMGLVNQVVTADRLDETVEEIVNYYTNAPTKTIGLIKKMLQKSYTMTLEEMLHYEAGLQDIASTTLDHQEGLKAFIEKRKPVFNGK